MTEKLRDYVKQYAREKRERARWAVKFERLLSQIEKMQSYGGRLWSQVNDLRKVWNVIKYDHRACENPKCFEAARDRRRYCSDRCANAERAQRFRDKHRAQLRK